MMGSETCGSIKRTKMAPMIELSNLPDQLLAAIAEYVVIPSQLLLAVALTAPSSSHKWSSHNVDVYHLSLASKGVLLLKQWEKVDFANLENSLVGILTDEDVGAVLSFIRLAGCEIKRLGLGCLDITGRGLESLHGPTSLEQIDITKAKVSSKILLPILESIVDSDRSALKHIASPKSAWSPEWQELWKRYFLLIHDRQPACLRCNTEISQRNHSETCHECFDTFCNSRFCRAYTSHCNRCDKWRCRGCIRRCPKCRECSECFTGPMESCKTCSIALCDRCIKKCPVCDTKGKIWRIHNRRKAGCVSLM